MSKSNVAILTTVVNFDLYGITSKLFPKGIKRYVIDGRNGMHGIHSFYYMFDKLSNENIEWLILADEDVVFRDSEVVFSIIRKMNEEGFSVSGVRDGGIIKHRKYNPIMVNTFFLIINFRDISKEWKKKEVMKSQYILPFEFEIEKSSLKGQYDINSLYEPYYCFFLWLKRKGKKFLYLDAQMLDDTISNNILFEGNEFAYHSWYARSYKVNEMHTERINSILYEMKIDLASYDNTSIIFKDKFFWIKMKVNKVGKKIMNKFK